MLGKIKAAVTWWRNLREQVTEAVLAVEKEFAGKSGAEKRAIVVRKLDALIDLPWWLDSLIDVDGMIIGYMVDKVCNALNILTDGDFSDVEIDAEKMAVVAEAPVDSLIRATSSTAATKQLTVDERLNELFQQYGIQAEAVDEARSEMDEPEPVVINTPGVFPTVIPEAVADSESDKWDRCISIVGIAEGGANFDVVNGQPVLKASAKNDKGGLTKHGITQGTLASAYAKGVVSHNGIVALTRDEAKHIYRTMYCDPYGWLELPFAACLCLLDATINHGLGGTARIAQRTCNALAKQEILVVDGKWGPKTRAAVWSMVEGHLEPEGCSQIFAAEFLKWRKDYFDRIIAADSSQAVFRNGWYNRLKMLAKECDVESPV